MSQKQTVGNPYPVLRNLNEEEDGAIKATDFFLTINTNQLVEEDMPPETNLANNREREVIVAVNNLFREIGNKDNDEEGPVAYIDFPRDDGVDNIQGQIAITYVFERIGEDKRNAGRFHIHALVQIRHNSHIKVANERLFEIIRTRLQLIGINPYIHLRYARTTFENMVEYMKKDLGRGPNLRNPRNNNNRDYSETEEESDDDF